MRKPDPPANNSLAELMRDEFEAREFGIAGFFSAPQPREPAPPEPPAFEIPPPDWEAEERERLAREETEPEPEQPPVVEFPPPPWAKDGS